jgi:hypothetical protein
MLHLPKWTVVEKGYSFTLGDGYYWVFRQKDTRPCIGCHNNEPWTHQMPVMHPTGEFEIITELEPGDVLYGPIFLPLAAFHDRPVALKMKLPVSDAKTITVAQVGKVTVTKSVFSNPVYLLPDEAYAYADYLKNQQIKAEYEIVLAEPCSENTYRQLGHEATFMLDNYIELVREHARSKLTKEECAILGIWSTKKPTDFPPDPHTHSWTALLK